MKSQTIKICSAMLISLSLVSGLSGCGADSGRDGDGDVVLGVGVKES